MTEGTEASSSRHPVVVLLPAGLPLFRALSVDEPLVVVVDRHGEGDLRLVLPDDVLVQGGLQLGGRGELLIGQGLGLPVVQVIENDVIAGVDALVADIEPRGAGNQEFHLRFAAAAEGAVALHPQLRAVPCRCHMLTPDLR